MRAASLSLLLLLFVAIPCLAHEDTDDHPSCGYCNMDRKVFGYSRMLIEYADGNTVGTCSIHCAARDLTVNITSMPCRISVGDYHSQKLIEATSAYWVIGGDQSGVMTQRAKWAFLSKAEAEAFVKAHGGRLASFSEALRAAFEDLYQDVQRSIDRVQERKARGWDMCNEHGG